MLLGLKRDLRTEGEGIIYPQEVGAYQTKQVGILELNFIEDLSYCPRAPL